MTECRIDGARCEMEICWPCAKHLRELLVGRSGIGCEPGIIWIIDQLTTQAYRQAALYSRVRSHRSSRDFTLLGDKRALDLLSHIHTTLDQWTFQVAKGANITITPGVDLTNIEMARWLADHLVALMSEPEIKNLNDALVSHAKAAHWIINRRPSSFVGPCSTTADDGSKCGAELYAEPTDEDVVCPRCKQTHQVVEIRRQALERLRAEPQQASHWLSWLRLLGEHLPPRSSFYAAVSRIPPAAYLHADGQRNQLRAAGAKPLYAYHDVHQAVCAGGS